VCAISVGSSHGLPRGFSCAGIVDGSWRVTAVSLRGWRVTPEEVIGSSIRRWPACVQGKDRTNIMPSFDEPCGPNLEWSTPAGRVIDQLVDALPEDRSWKIILFGSSPLQLAIDPTFLSGDVDIIPSADVEDYCRQAGLLKGQAPIYVEPCAVTAFTASADWMM